MQGYPDTQVLGFVSHLHRKADYSYHAIFQNDTRENDIDQFPCWHRGPIYYGLACLMDATALSKNVQTRSSFSFQVLMSDTGAIIYCHTPIELEFSRHPGNELTTCLCLHCHIQTSNWGNTTHHKWAMSYPKHTLLPREVDRVALARLYRQNS